MMDEDLAGMGRRAYFLIIRGPLGAGKTTVARALAKALGGRTIAIDPILERWAWDGGSAPLFLRANRVAAQEAGPSLESGRPVIFDGNFYWQTAIEDLRGRLPFPSEVFTLELPVEECIERDRRRGLSYGEQSTREVYAKSTRFDYGHKVDARGSVAQVVARILAELPSAWRAVRGGGRSRRTIPYSSRPATSRPRVGSGGRPPRGGRRPGPASRTRSGSPRGRRRPPPSAR
jgi:thymidylate kinase